MGVDTARLSAMVRALRADARELRARAGAALQEAEAMRSDTAAVRALHSRIRDAAAGAAEQATLLERAADALDLHARAVLGSIGQNMHVGAGSASSGVSAVRS